MATALLVLKSSFEKENYKLLSRLLEVLKFIIYVTNADLTDNIVVKNITTIK